MTVSTSAGSWTGDATTSTPIDEAAPLRGSRNRCAKGAVGGTCKRSSPKQAFQAVTLDKACFLLFEGPGRWEAARGQVG